MEFSDKKRNKQRLNILKQQVKARTRKKDVCHTEVDKKYVNFSGNFIQTSQDKEQVAEN